MRSTFVQKLLAVTALVASTAISSGIAQSDENAGKRAAGERGGAVSQTLVECDGSAQEAVVTNTQNALAITGSSSFVVIPSTTIPGGGSGADADLYTVTFSGEAGATLGGNWEIQAQISVNGGLYSPMNPVDPDTFHSGNAAQTHTMTWCKRVTASSTNFRILWRKNGGGTARIDDYLMRVERSN